MDYFEIIKKIEDFDKLTKENEELKQRLSEAEQKPAVSLESSVVQAFKSSDEYKMLESNAFNAFLQEKFLKEFERSKQAEWFIKTAQESFKVFEKKYNNKEVKSNGQTNKRTEKQVPETDSGQVLQW